MRLAFTNLWAFSGPFQTLPLCNIYESMGFQWVSNQIRTRGLSDSAFLESHGLQGDTDGTGPR